MNQHATHSYTDEGRHHWRCECGLAAGVARTIEEAVDQHHAHVTDPGQSPVFADPKGLDAALARVPEPRLIDWWDGTGWRPERADLGYVRFTVTHVGGETFRLRPAPAHAGTVAP